VALDSEDLAFDLAAASRRGVRPADGSRERSRKPGLVFAKTRSGIRESAGV